MLVMIDRMADIVKAQEKFKKDTKWKPWKESVVTYLHSKSGQANVPLAAIVRDSDVPIPGVVYATSHDELLECSILVGPSLRLTMALSMIYCILSHTTVPHGAGCRIINALVMGEPLGRP